MKHKINDVSIPKRTMDKRTNIIGQNGNDGDHYEIVNNAAIYAPKTEAWGSQKDGSHYKTMPIQPMEYSMANKLNALQHTIMKYVSRYPEKNGIADLEKAKHCIQMLIDWEINN